MTRTLSRALATAGVAALLVAGLAMPAGAASGTTVYVIESDLSSVNFSEGPAPTNWDAPSGKPAAVIPAAGTKWVLDIEDKREGLTDITADGLVLTTDLTPPPGSVANDLKSKVRYQYYIGSGGYPAIDAQHPTLDQFLQSPISWDLKLISGDRTEYGPTFQIQLQKPLPNPANGYARVTVVSIWNPTDTSQDLLAGRWFANTHIYAGGYGSAATYDPIPNTTILNNKFSSPGVLADVLIDNFGDFEVVSFGPNLGRDFAYGFAFQNLTALGHTFKFVTQLPAAPPASPTSGGTTTPPATARNTSSELPTFSLPTATPTPTPSPSDSEEPAPPSDDGDGDGDEVIVADPPKPAEGFPMWIVFVGGGFLVLLLAFLVWLLRRRAV
jgi:hypothetical protein